MKILLTALLATGAHAQTATWTWEVLTDDGDALVEPGETASVTLTMDLTPDAGEGDVLGFGGAAWDTLGSGGALNGQIVDWEILNDLAEVYGDLTITDGVSLFGTVAADLPGVGPDTFFDPIDVLRFDWVPDVYEESTAVYDTFTSSIFTGDAGMVDVFLERTPGDYELVQWPVAEAQVAIQVVPGPGAGLALVLLGLATRCRRSHSRA